MLEWSFFLCCASARCSADDAEDVFLAHDQELVADDLDLGAGVGAEEHRVADLDRERRALAVIQELAFADGDDLAFLGLLLRALGEQDSAGGALLGFDALNENAVAEGTDLPGGGLRGLGG